MLYVILLPIIIAKYLLIVYEKLSKYLNAIIRLILYTSLTQIV